MGTDNGSVWYVNWQEHSSIRLVTSSPASINAVEFDADSKKFVTCADDGSLRVWLLEDREQILQFHVPEQVSAGAPTSCMPVCYDIIYKCIIQGSSRGLVVKSAGLVLKFRARLLQRPSVVLRRASSSAFPDPHVPPDLVSEYTYLLVL